MPPETIRIDGPAPEQFAGDSFSAAAARLFHATRPKFFPASVLPVAAGSAWGYTAAGQFDVLVFALALLATVCVHAGANVLNDVGDEAGGTDRQNEERIYPYTGGSRFIQAGIISSNGMARLGIGLLAIAAVAGLLLLLLRGQMILWFGLAGVALAVMYSLGPVKLASIGLGEIAVGVGLGMLPVVGAAWLQSGLIDLNTVMFALPVCSWVMAILLINEVPDVCADAATGKNTWPVRFGTGATAVIYLALQFTATGAVAWLAFTGALPLAAIAVPLGLLVLALKAAAAIRQGVSNRPRLTTAIESTLAIHTVGSIWLTLCALYVALWGIGQA